jgi:hypothetical protein
MTERLFPETDGYILTYRTTAVPVKTLVWSPEYRASREADSARGAFLCEGCQDAMTDQVLAADVSPTGREMACCRACAVRLRRD